MHTHYLYNKERIAEFANRLFSLLTLIAVSTAVSVLSSCNKSLDEEIIPEPDVVKTLDLTVTGENVQAPYGNVYLFHSEDVNLDYALGYGDGVAAPLIDVTKPYNPVVRYSKDGEQKVLKPVSAYGTKNDGALDNYSSVRYSKVHFDIPRLASTYGKVEKGSVVLVVIVLDDPQTRSWVARTVQLRRDYLIHISMPDHKTQTYITGNELNSKWWQVEGEE